MFVCVCVCGVCVCVSVCVCVCALFPGMYIRRISYVADKKRALWVWCGLCGLLTVFINPSHSWKVHHTHNALFCCPVGVVKIPIMQRVKP